MHCDECCFRCSSQYAVCSDASVTERLVLPNPPVVRAPLDPEVPRNRPDCPMRACSVAAAPLNTRPFLSYSSNNLLATTDVWNGASDTRFAFCDGRLASSRVDRAMRHGSSKGVPRLIDGFTLVEDESKSV